MVNKAALAGTLILVMSTGCGQQALGVAEAVPAPQAETKAETKVLADLPTTIQAEALARIPTIRSQRIQAMFDALAKRHPDAAESLNATKVRLLSLDKAQLKALRAVLWQEMKDKTVEEVHQNCVDMIEDPAKMTEKLQAAMDQVDKLDAKGVKALAATLPPALDKLEAFQLEVVKAFLAKTVRRLGIAPYIPKS